MLGLQLLAHSKVHRALVECLISRVSDLDLVSDASQEQASFRLVESNLSDKLVEALAEELFAHGAQASVSSLPLEKFLVEHLTKTGNIDTGGWLVAHVLHEMLSLLHPLSWRQDSIEDFFGTNWTVFHCRKSCLFVA